MATVHIMEPASSHVALLHRISNIVSSELSLDEMLGEIVGLTVQVTDCDACLVYLLDRDTDEVVLRASQVPHAAALGNLRMKIGEGVTGWVAEHKSVVALSSKAGSRRPLQALSNPGGGHLRSFPFGPAGERRAKSSASSTFTIASRTNTTAKRSRLLTFIGEQMGGAIAKSSLSEANARLHGRDAGDEAPAGDAQTGGARQRNLAAAAQPYRRRSLPPPSQREPAAPPSHEGTGRGDHPG